jgi:nuclear pore complex protein Nup98-Nup96
MPSGGGLFGSPSTAQAAAPGFGGFGATASAGGAATPFGQVMGGTQSPGGMGAAQAAPPGTRGVPYCPTLQQDGAGSNTSGAPATNVAFNVITAMPAYAGKSVEELRWEDYQQGVRGGSGNVSTIAQLASSQPGGSGASPGGNTFGGAFGGASSSGGFGQPAGGMTPFGQQQPGTSLFGQAQTQPGASPFGAAPGSGGAFGAKPAFGSTTPGTSAFGAATNPFGAPQQSAPAPFGQASAATPFGQAGGANAFGSNPFGAKPQTTTPFGAPQQATTGGMFGQPQQQGTTPFGTAPPGGGLFGAQQPQQQQQQQPFGAGAFGATQPQAGGNLFGQMPGTTPGGTSLFGQAPGTGAGANPFGGGAAQPGGGLFGSTAPAGGGLFGASLAPGGQQASSMPAFGATNTSPGTGMLGGNMGGGGLFGAGAFGTAPAQGGGMFGTAPQQQQQPLGGSSLFGGGGLTTPTTGGLNFGAPAGGVFGGLSNPFAATSSLTSPAPTSLFGTMPFGGTTPGLGMMGGAMVAAPTGPPNPYGLPPARAEYLGMDAPSPGATPPAQQGAGSYTQQQQALSRSPLLLAPPPPKALQPPKSAAAVLSARRRGTMALGASTGGMALATSGGMGGASPNGGAGALGMRTPSGFSVGTSSPGQASLQLGGMMDGGGTGGGGGDRDGGTGSPYADAFMPRDNPRALVIRSDRVAAATADLLDGAAAATPAAAGNGSTPDGTPATRGDGHIAGGPGLFASPPPSSDRTPPKDEPHGTANGTADGGHAARAHVAANGGSGSPPQGGDIPAPPLVGPSADLVPRLTLPGHFMRPSPQELAQCPRDALAAVADFTVVRLGVAQIKWLVPVDVRGLNLDDIIRFSKRSVAVYPHDDGPLAPVKPPQGQGLNCPAEISYSNIFKLDKATGAPVQSPREVDAFKHKLRRVLAAQDGAQFVSYDADSGAWVFRVQHFSKYGLPDEDDDDDVDMGGGGDDEDGPWGVVMAPAPPQQQHQRPVASPLQAQATNQLLLSDMKPAGGIMQSQALVTAARMSAAAQQLPPPTAPPLPPVYTPLAAPPPGAQPRTAGVLTDAGLAMGRSFRVGWAPDGRVFYPSSDGTQIVSAPTSGWVHPAPGATLALAACMRVHRSHAVQALVPGPDGAPMPLWRLACSADTLGALCSSYLRALDATVAAAVTACPAGPRAGAAEVAAHTQALQLVAVCHARDPGSVAAQEESGLEAVARRAGVLAWLAEPDMTRTPGADVAQAKAAHAPCGPALHALAAGRTADAVAACVASGDPRHATLVAQSGGAGSLRQLLTQQLHQHGTGHIAPGRALLLRLLAGDVAAGGKGLTAHWKAAMLLHARLGADPAQPLAHVLAAYEAAVAAGQAPGPVPGYPAPRGGAIDVGYALLKHSCRPDGSFGPPGDAASLTQVVTPSGYTQRPWNAAPGWHLGSTLLAPSPNSSSTTAFLSCAAYDAASQLCGCPDLVPWAIYACLTMGDAPAAAAASAQAILCRYWPAIAAQPGGVAFLLNRVGVPPAWLATAAGLWAKHSTRRGDAPLWWPLLNAEGEHLSPGVAPDAHYPGETHGSVEPALVAVAHSLRTWEGSVEAVCALPSSSAPSHDMCAHLDAVACGAA